MPRWLVLAVVSGVVAFAAMEACSFPSPSFSSDDTIGPDASTDGTLDGAGNPDVDRAPDGGVREDAGEVLIDGSSPDALIVQDAGQKVDASGCAPADCDCDKDGFNETLKAGCGTGPRDCDDSDPRAKPGQGFLTAPAEPPQFADWNCDGTATPLYDVNVTCDGLTLGLGCSNIFGFKDAPQCGKVGTWIRCARASLISLNCTIGEQAQLPQPCQ